MASLGRGEPRSGHGSDRRRRSYLAGVSMRRSRRPSVIPTLCDVRFAMRAGGIGAVRLDSRYVATPSR